MTDNTTQDRVPVSILTGFLGSGKTTLLSKLMQAENMDKVAVIINEFGEVGIDDALVVKSNEDTILLNNGCLCCTVRGDLVETMHRLHVQQQDGQIPEFNRLIVETTGLADPAPILHTMMSDQFLISRYRLDGVVTVVDAHHGMSQFDQQFESVKQAAVADRIVLSKVFEVKKISHCTAIPSEISASSASSSRASIADPLTFSLPISNKIGTAKGDTFVKYLTFILVFILFKSAPSR